MRLQRFSDKKIIVLGAELGGGGEGKIYEVNGETSLVAKVYHQGKNTNTEKLRAMYAHPPHDPAKAQNHISIAWTLDLLLNVNSQEIVGFLMGKAANMRPIHSFYTPKNRRQHLPGFNYLYLHRTARNLASAVSALHSSDYVIGDVNESNILVAETALITLVDTDSFQVRNSQNGKIYRCPVGKAEFTPPELQGKNFRDIDRNLEHDLFGLGVLIFQLLMEGTHPFEGIFQGTGEPPAKEKRIFSGHFPYSKNVPYTPKPFAPSFDTLSPALQKLFKQCFVDGHQNPTARPDAQTWVKTIEEAEHNLITCSSNPNHLYGNHLKVCPWCERTVKLKGRDPFPAQQATKHQQIPLQSPTKRSATSVPSNPPATPRLTIALNNCQQVLATCAQKGKYFYSGHKKLVRLSAAGVISLSAIAVSANVVVQKVEQTRILEQKRQAAIVAEAERKERERLAAIRAESERKKQEQRRQAAIRENRRREEAARIARVEAARKERERLAAVKAEQERQAAMRAEAERKEKARLAAKAEAERKEKERLAAIVAEQQKQRQAAIDAERKRERERQAAIVAEKQRQRQAAIQAQKAKDKAIQAERQRQAATRAQKQQKLSSPATQHNTGASQTSNSHKPWESPAIKSNSENLEDIIRRGK